MKKKLNINEKKLKKIVSESIKKVVNEDFKEGETVESLLKKMYEVGADLSMNKDAEKYSIHAVGSYIMYTCEAILELYKGEPSKEMFQGLLNNKIKSLNSNKNGGV